MVWGQRSIRCAAGKRNCLAVSVNDELRFGVATQHAPHITDVVQQTGNYKMVVIGWFDSLAQGHSLQNVTSDHRDLKGVLEIVVKRVASAQAFDGTACQRGKAFRYIIMRRPENTTEIPGQKFRQFV